MNDTVDPPTAPIDTVSTIPSMVAGVRQIFEGGRTRSARWRETQLRGIARFLDEQEDVICQALAEDLGKPTLEAWSSEVNYCQNEVSLAVGKLASWMRPEPVKVPLIAMPGKARVHREPLGVVLIIAPWNYPFQLLVAPLIGAIAAGNCVVVKPSEVSAATSRVIAEYLPKYVDPEAIRVVEGAIPEATALLAERWDHIFYTGNATVGRIVMTAAARHLTPVTLELGGKSPVIVDKDADLDVSARRIAWGKWFNSGQTCVAPDYVLVHAAVHDALLRRLRSTVVEFYGADPSTSQDYGRIVNARHHRRLMSLMGCGDVVLGGQADEDSLYIAPTILQNVDPESPVMQDEIFGPILPVLSVPNIDAAIAFINGREKPLALYVFSSSRGTQNRVLERTSSGGACVNHTWMHMTIQGLPFGGVGESGMGAYHGRHSFETFSHRKSVLHKPVSIDPSVVYPPFGNFKKKLIRTLL